MKNLSLALAAACALAAAGCSGGGSHAALPATGAPPPVTPQQLTSPNFAYDTSALSGATVVARASVGALSVDLVPRMQNASGLLSYAAAANDPKSGSYRHFLTPAQIGQQYGASQADYTAAETYLRGKGLTVDGWPQRLLLHVTGTQAAVESALGTTFAWYRNGNTTFLAPASAPSVPTTVPIVGATNLVMRTPNFVDSTVVRNGGMSNGLTYGYAPQQIAAAFDYTGAYNVGFTGAGITVGIIGTGGFSAADVPAYRSMFHVPGSGTAVMVAATNDDNAGNSASGFATPPPVTRPCGNGTSVSPVPGCNPEDGETQIDTEQVAGLAYDANIRYYLAYDAADACGVVGTTCPPGTGIPLQGLGEVDAELQTAIAENKADILSLSFGGPEAAQVGYEFNAAGHGLEPLEFAALASEGTAIFVSSGDSGAEGCMTWTAAPNPDSTCVSYPSTDPSVVSVGGTNTPLNSAGNFVGPLTGWGAQTSMGNGGSGGGVSAYFTLPAYQQGAAGVTGTMRNVPDVALNGDDHTGVATLLYGGTALGPLQIVSYGGTSVAAPEAAAMWALVLQACKETSGCADASGAVSYRLGNPDPYFYKIYANATQYPSVFTDVLYGNNAQSSTCSNPASPCPSTDPGYSAGTGYDLITGIGAPHARALITAVVGR
ncbi:MAG TPA: protease pro-enzyme activation domain-containing protein [Candidatus Limnocylindria bacterium]|nr:protease pro-enzyme activation domain-containing protein [Candidatus Limnocylindria bacterium]